MAEQRWDPEDLHRRIASLGRWHHSFDLAGIRTPSPDGFDRWHAQRAELIVPALRAAAGGDLRGLRVLDLGCNAGYWSLLAIESSCDFVLGMDHDPASIEQAKLVFEVRGVEADRYRFEVGDAFHLDASLIGQFDVVLCLGLLYHVSRPQQLIAAVAEVTSDILVIDTQLVDIDGPVFLLHEDPSAIDGPFALKPSAAAVERLARSQGFDVVRLRSEAEPDRYRDGHRGAFLCSRRAEASHPVAAS